MEVDFKQAVERRSRRTVTAFISGNHAEPDVASSVNRVTVEAMQLPKSETSRSS